MARHLGVASSQIFFARFNGNLIPAYFCLAAVVLNHSIFRLGGMSLGWAVLLILVIVVATLLAPDVQLRASETSRLGTSGVIIGVIALAPLIASVVLGWNREFAFGGDQSFHIKQTIYMAYWWLSPVGSAPLGILGRALDVEMVRQLLSHPLDLLLSRAFVLAIGVTIFAFCYRRHRLVSLVLATIVLVSWGLFERTIYLRYPGGWYMLAVQMLGPALLSGNLELAGRLTSATAAAVWLFGLRPYFLGRWPDVRILPAVACLLWQKDVLYYFDAAYTEPWTFVVVLVAVELLIARGRQAAPAACLLIGLAAVFKEPPILALPFVWLAGMPWQGEWSERLRLLGVGLAAGFPFVLYFAARKSVDIQDLVTDRSVQFDTTFGEFLKFVQEFFFKMSVAFSGMGLAVAALALIAILFVVWKRPSWSVPVALMVMAGVVIALLFSLDRNSLEVPGEFRFFLYSLPFLAVGVIALGYAVRPATALVIGVVILILQFPNASLAVLRSADRAPRDFTEFYDTPIVFPLKSLVGEAKRKGYLPADVVIQANMLHEGVRPVPGTPVTFGPMGTLYCECTTENPATLALFVRYINYSARFADHAPGAEEVLPPLYRDRDRMWREQRASRLVCLAKLRTSCTHILERTEGDELIAVLGLR